MVNWVGMVLSAAHMGWVGVENYCDFFWVENTLWRLFFFLPEWLKSGFVRPATSSSSSFFFPSLLLACNRLPKAESEIKHKESEIKQKAPIFLPE
jgi:hypothetical protein